MASRKIIKKKIKNEYLKLEEDILRILTSKTKTNVEDLYELLDKTRQSRDEFVKAINDETNKTKEQLKQVITKVVDDIDQHFNKLKEFIKK